MSVLPTIKVNTLPKVHYTEYIVAENEPKESGAGIPKHVKQLNAMKAPMITRRHTVFMRAMARKLHVKR
jgi:hypothetical protein